MRMGFFSPLRIFALIVLLVFAFPGFSFAAEIYLQDVPEGHYANDAVYDLINRGVIGGYPDGTFRGKKLVNRYELASFLSKLSNSFNVKRGTDEKLVEELKSETSLLQYAADKKQKEARISGEVETRWRAARTETARGVKADYRLRTKIVRFFGDTASLAVNLDTMDAGFDGGTRDFSRELLDFEGKVKLGAASLRATAGPGDVTHIDDGLFPAENNMIYIRPKRTLSLAANLGKTCFSLEYLARSAQASGLVTFSEINAKVSQTFPLAKFTLNPRYFYNASGERDIRAELSGDTNFGLGGLAGFSKAEDFPHNLYLRGSLKLGEEVKIVLQKIGSSYREKAGLSYSIFDLFDRNIPDGYYSLGLDINKEVGKNWFVRWKADYKNPGETLTSEITLGCNLLKEVKIGLTYQTYRDSDWLGLGLNGKF